MRTAWLLILGLLSFAPVLRADVIVPPDDLNMILDKIAKRQTEIAPAPASAAQIVFKDNQIVVMQKAGGGDSAIYFSDQSPTIAKHFRLKSQRDEYAFAAILKQEGGNFQRIVRQINGIDALVFFNDRDVFVYTQTAGQDGRMELKEWIYARKPNTPKGSEWTWVFKAEPFDWPLSLSMNQDGTAKIERNVPFAGIPTDPHTRQGYMLQLSLKFRSGDNVKKYFPFHEEIASIPPAKFMTNEGIQRQADIGISDNTIVDTASPQPKRGLDFNRWDNYWQSVYKISVAADAKEYPILVEPD